MLLARARSEGDALFFGEMGGESGIPCAAAAAAAARVRLRIGVVGEGEASGALIWLLLAIEARFSPATAATAACALAACSSASCCSLNA